jgi:DNA-binding FrmR family transcriptional regulator
MEMQTVKSAKSKKIAKTKGKTPNCCDPQETAHPDHSKVLPRIKRAEGQLRGIAAMIEDRRYCVDIITQVRAVTAALRSIELEVFESHTKSCVRDAMNTKDPKVAEQKISEIIELFGRRSI